VTIELPDVPATEDLSPEDLRLELACALFAQHKVSSIAGARLAGVDLFSFQRALGERGIDIVTAKQLAEDVETLNHLFPS
jgi:predicted HTH domain antitoxin